MHKGVSRFQRGTRGIGARLHAKQPWTIARGVAGLNETTEGV
jgi:hypothetical protein